MKKEHQTIFRIHKEDGDFFIMPKSIVNDENISWKAKGLMAYLLSKPDDWTVYLADVIKRSPDGKASVNSGINELEEVGYIKRVQNRDETGKYEPVTWHVYEQPITATRFSGSGKTGSGKPASGKPATTNNKDTKNKDTKNKPPADAEIPASKYNIAREYEKIAKRPISSVLYEELEGYASDWDAHTYTLAEKHTDKTRTGKEVVVEAMRETYLNIGKVHHSYVRSIVDNWITNGYKAQRKQSHAQPAVMGRVA